MTIAKNEKSQENLLAFFIKAALAYAAAASGAASG